MVWVVFGSFVGDILLFCGMMSEVRRADFDFDFDRMRTLPKRCVV